jgi:MYXO-CTERM domain-containing protein
MTDVTWQQPHNCKLNSNSTACSLSSSAASSSGSTTGQKLLLLLLLLLLALLHAPRKRSAKPSSDTLQLFDLPKTE